MSTCWSQLLFIDFNSPIKKLSLTGDRCTGALQLTTGHRWASAISAGSSSHSETAPKKKKKRKRWNTLVGAALITGITMKNSTIKFMHATRSRYSLCVWSEHTISLHKKLFRWFLTQQHLENTMREVGPHHSVTIPFLNHHAPGWNKGKWMKLQFKRQWWAQSIAFQMLALLPRHFKHLSVSPYFISMWDASAESLVLYQMMHWWCQASHMLTYWEAN